MKNRYWQFLAMGAFGMFLTQPAEARQLTPNQSLTRAHESSAAMSGMRKIRSAAQPRLVKTMLTERQGIPAFYVFENPEGLMITSADDRLPALLGYAEKGTLSEMPANMEWWLSQYEQEIGAYYDSAAEATPQWVNTYDQYAEWTPLATLCQTQWNQNSPFNDQCPMLGSTRTVTGCVATALAQIVRYKGYMNCRGKYEYNWASGNKKLSFDYDNYQVDFSLLRDAYKGGATQAQRDEVAKLMLAVGIAVGSNYNSATGASFNLDGIRDYLGYGDSFSVSRDGLSSAEWERICYNFIKDGFPLGYLGSGSGGHAFVCDGYSENGFFHFNWGWGGISDGYFRLSALNPRDQGIGSFEGGYTMGQSITIIAGDNDDKMDISNIRPGSISWDPNKPLYVSGVSTTKSTNTVTINLGIRYVMMNSIAYMQDAGLGLVLYNRDGQGENIYIAPNSYKSISIKQASDDFSVKFNRSILTPGAEYDAYPVYGFRDYDGLWRLGTYGNPAQTDHWLITMDKDNKVTCKPTSAVNLGLNAYEMETNDLYIGDNANTFKCLLVNSSPEDINETITLKLYQQTKEDQYDPVKDIATSYMLLAAGESMQLEATFSLSDLKEAGNYAFMLYNSTRGQLLGAPSELYVTINAGKRPEDTTKKPQLTNNYQVALWADGKMQDMAPQTVLSGDDLKLTTSVITATSQTPTYQLAIFNHGETYPAIAKFDVETTAVKGNGTWQQNASIDIKPELPLGVYTMAFIDQYEGLVSYPTDLYINAEVDGVRYSFDSEFDGLIVYSHNGALSGHLEIPSEVDGHAVKSIADGVFEMNRALTGVTLPEGIEKIGLNAFHAATGLRAVSLSGKTLPFANVAIPFGAIAPKTEFYVPAESYTDYQPAFFYRGHAQLYAAITELKLPSEAAVEINQELDLAPEVTPAEKINPNFTVTVADPDILSAEMKEGKLHITPLSVGETDVELSSPQPGAPKATVKVSVKGLTDSLTEITTETPDTAYDLLGRKVSTNARGLQIINGKIILKK